VWGDGPGAEPSRGWVFDDPVVDPITSMICKAVIAMP
jgi:hypothetical protein